MKKLIAALVFGFCTMAGGFAVAGVPEGYVTQDLIACWDAIDNQATGVHDPNAASWVDLVGGAKYDLQNTVWEADALYFNGTPVSYGVMRDAAALAALFDHTPSAKTIELVFKYDDATSAGCLLGGKLHSGHRDTALGRAMNPPRFVFGAGQTDWDAREAKDVPTDAFCTLSDRHSGEWDVVDGSCLNNVKMTKGSTKSSGWGGDEKHATIGCSWTSPNGSAFKGRLYAIRVYGRYLSDAERTQNYAVDVARFRRTPAATVVSGSVTVDGTTYGAGEVVRMDVDTNALAIASASAAVLTVDSRLRSLAVTNGAVTIAGTTANDLLRLETLSLGPDATLKLQATDIYVSGAIVADETAKVQGPGTLIGAAETAPVTLDGATYLCETAAFAWPDAGVAYIPVGVTVAIDDTAKVDALGKIVFLDTTSTLTYGLSAPWKVTTPVEGPGTFAVTSAGPMTLAADNAGLTGTFSIHDTYVAVSNRYGLGSYRTKLVDFDCGEKLDALRFGGEGLVCDAPIELTTADAKKYACIGPDLPTETLIFSNKVLVMQQLSGIAYRNNVRFRGGHVGGADAANGDSKHFYPARSSDSPVRPSVWFENRAWIHANHWFAAGCDYHFGEICRAGYIGALMAYTGSARVIYECENALYSTVGIGVYTDVNNSGVHDLNGYSQAVGSLYSWYASETGYGIVVTSAVEAVVRATGGANDANHLNIPARFRGAAGYTHAQTYTINFDQWMSDTTGPLTIEKGGLRLRNGAGWGGTNVTVKAGASLIVADTAAAQPFVRPGTRAETTLTIEETGTLVLDKTDKPVKVRNFTYAGVPMERGIYTKANCAGIDGEGALSVLGHPGLTLIVR